MSSLMTFLCWLLLSVETVAYGYVGPGLGAGTIGAILGVIGSIGLALFAVLWYPIKRLFKKRSKSKSAQ